MTPPAGSSLRFTCPHCGGSVKTPRSQAGAACLCPKCGQPITAPETDQAGASSRPTPASGSADTPDRDPSMPPRSESADTSSGQHEPFRLSDPVETPQYQPLVGDVPDELRANVHPPQPTAPSSDSASAGEPEPPVEIRVVCRTCASRLDVHPRNIGRVVICPDCHTKNRVQAPPQESKRPSVPQESGEPLALQDSSASSGGGPSDRAATFGFSCKLCGTRLYARESQTGEKLACPDCDTVNVVPTPPPTRAGESSLSEGDASFRLSDPIVPPKYEPQNPTLARDVAAAAQQPPPPQAAAGQPAPNPPDATAGDRIPTVGDDAMAKAEAEYDEQKHRRPDLPDRPLWTGVLEFCRFPSTWARWLAVSIGLTLVIVLGNSAMALSAGGPMEKFLSAVCCAAVAVVGPATAALGAACCLAITVDTGNGYDEIASWPDLDFLNWLPNCFCVITSLFGSVLVALPLYWLLEAAGAPDWAKTALLTVVAFFLFPIGLLSMLETGSSIMPFSRPIWNSLSASQRLWRLFYGESAGLLAAVLLGLWVLSTGGQITLPLSAAWLVAGCMIYFRLLGRLAWACQEPDASAPDESDA